MTRKTKRNIAEEILEGLQAIKAHYEGKLTLRTYKIEKPSLPEVDAQLIRDTRERLGDLRLSIPGRHNLQDALAALHRIHPQGAVRPGRQLLFLRRKSTVAPVFFRAGPAAFANVRLHRSGAESRRADVVLGQVRAQTF